MIFRDPIIKLNVASKTALLALLFFLGIPSLAWSACTSPTGVDGQVGYDAPNHLLQYCNGTTWVVPGAAAVGGSTGYVQFNNASALSGDSNLFWDNTNKRLGIGTASPHGTLTVLGSSNDQLEIGVAASYPYVFESTDGANFYFDVNRRTADGVFGNTSATHDRITMSTANGAGYISFAATNTNNTQAPEIMRISGNGYVGIGAAPTYGKLHVTGVGGAGNVWANFNNSDYNGSSVGSGINFRPGATSGDTYSIIQAFQTGGTAVANLSLNNFGGNVGIGTATPLYLLQAEKDQNTTTSIAIKNATAGTAANTSLQVLNDAGDDLVAGLPSSTFTPVGILAARTGYLYSTGTGGMALAAGSGPIKFAANGTTEQMRLDTSGNVGIGSATPGYKLDVNGTLHAAGAVTFDSTVSWGGGSARTETRTDAGAQGVQSGFFQNDGSTVTNYPSGASGWWHLLDVRHSNSANNYAMQIAGSFFDQDLYFRKTAGTSTTSWNKFVYANSSGYVGIGTTSATNPLTVVGNSASLATVWATNTNASGPSIMGYNGSTGAYAQLGVGSYAGIFMNGNVGIGTAVAGYRLMVYGVSPNYAASFTSGGGTTTTSFARDDVGVYAQTTAASTWGVESVVFGANSQAIVGNATASSGIGAVIQNQSTGYYCYIGTGSFSIQCSGPTSGISDRRLKKDIRPLEANEGLSAIMKLEPVHYRWKDERMNKAHPDGEIGFIAQSVEAVLPILVSESVQPKDAPIKLDGGKQKGLQYERLVAPLVKAVQELKADSDTLKAANDNLKAANDNLRHDLEELRREIQHVH
jgi:hypothetical protein